MQVITDLADSINFIKNLRQSLSDQSYWKEWSAIHVTATPELDWIKQGKITALLRAKLPNGDGSILWLEGCLLVVFKERGDFKPDAFAQMMAQSLHLTDPRVELLSVVNDTQAFTALLTRYMGTPYLKKRDERPASLAFLKAMLPNIEDLFRDWHCNKQIREGRTSPLVMIVDDDLMTLKLVGKTLERENEVITAQTGAEAIAKHLQFHPDIIFLDIGLPDCDGLTVLNYIQQYDKECRIIMFSADEYLKTRVSALAGGAIGYLRKPFNLQGFQKYIKEWVAPSKKG